MICETVKKLNLEEIRNAFSVEALNEELYKIVARYFYQLVGATEGKGAKAITYDRVLHLPIGKPSDNVSKKIYQEFAVRLIGRTVFCWFLKVKKSDEGISLLPEHLLSSESVKKNSNYYHSILEKLFFQTLNTPREIVDYMATESLVLYLHNQTQIDKELLNPIFEIDSEVSFSKSDSEKILEALDRLKIPS